MNMLKATLLMTVLLTAPVTFSALTQTEVTHISVSAMSDSPSVMEDAIARLAQEKDAASRRITSIRIDDSTHTAAILHR